MCEIYNFGYEKRDGLCQICAEVDQWGEDVHEKDLHDHDEGGINADEDDDDDNRRHATLLSPSGRSVVERKR